MLGNCSISNPRNLIYHRKSGISHLLENNYKHNKTKTEASKFKELLLEQKQQFVANKASNENVHKL